MRFRSWWRAWPPCRRWQIEAPDLHLPLVRSPTRRMLAHALASRQSRFLVIVAAHLAGYAVFAGGARKRFAELLIGSKHLAEELDSLTCASALRNRINPAVGRGHFSSSSTATKFASHCATSYSLKINTLPRAEPLPARPLACSQNDGSVCLQTTIDDFLP